MKLKGRTVCSGRVEGEAIVTSIPFSFLGELDPKTGKVPSEGHELKGQSIAGKIFVFPTGKGSTTGPTIAWMAKKAGTGPKAMVCMDAGPVIALAAIATGTPTVDRMDKNPVEVIKTGDHVIVNADEGTVEIVGR